MAAGIRAHEIKHVKGASSSYNVFSLSSPMRWWNMKVEKTRSKDPSGYGSSCENP